MNSALSIIIWTFEFNFNPDPAYFLWLVFSSIVSFSPFRPTGINPFPVAASLMQAYWKMLKGKIKVFFLLILNLFLIYESALICGKRFQNKNYLLLRGALFIVI